MISAIGIPSSILQAPSGDAALRGQLARYEKELSACINCSTAKTSEGKQKIDQISGEIERIKTRLEQASSIRSATQSQRNTLDAAHPTDSSTHPQEYIAAASASPRIGGLIDLLA